jgi:hypothetical protein
MAAAVGGLLSEEAWRGWWSGIASHHLPVARHDRNRGGEGGERKGEVREKERSTAV